MVAQIWAAGQVEREMGWYLALTIGCLFDAPGSIAFTIVYFAGGIYGFILGGNFLRTGIPSVGASGALFATVCLAVPELAEKENACVLVDLLLHWQYEERPKLKVGYAGETYRRLSYAGLLLGHRICHRYCCW
jgi:hypothetical protein